MTAIPRHLKKPLRSRTTAATVPSVEHSFRLLVEGVKDYAIIILDPAGNVVSWNAGAERIKGYRAEEIIGKNFSIFYPSEAVQRGQPENALRTAAKDGRSEDEGWRVRKDGETFWASVVITALRDKDGTVRGFSKVTRDLSERKQMENALRQASAYNRSLIEASLDPLVTIGPDGKITDVNAATEAATGWPREVLIGRDFSDYFTEPEKARAGWQQAFRDGMVRDYPLNLRHRDGRVISILYNASVYRDESGKVTGVFAAARDVTERKRAEEALRREQTLFTDLANTMPDHIYFKDRQSRFIRINDAMARSFGLRDVTEAVGKTDFDIFTEEHARQAFADEQRIMETGEPKIGIEEKETWPDGHVTWVSTTKVPLRDAQGWITGMVGISRDITERKLADAQLREQNEILSKSHEGVMIENLAKEITLWNRGAEEIFGWTASEALGRSPEELLGAESLDALSALRVAVERDGNWNGEIRLKNREGRNLIVDNRTTFVRDEAGRPRARLSFFADITEKKLFEEKFLHAQRIESIGMLASGIAHDLNNVLAPIMFAEPLLRESLSSPRDLRILDTFKQCAERGAGLVKQILGFVHSTAGEFQPTQVKHIARDIISVIEGTFPKSIELQQTIPSDLWPVLGNATQIHQVLLNLCVNARDAMPQGGKLRIVLPTYLQAYFSR